MRVGDAGGRVLVRVERGADGTVHPVYDAVTERTGAGINVVAVPCGWREGTRYIYMQPVLRGDQLTVAPFCTKGGDLAP